MDEKKLETILEAHGKWLAGNGGERADLRSADLCDARLCDANLYDANLCDASLCGADLCGANLCGADLYGADLYGADLRGASLCGANLYGADLYGADLRGASLCGANLYGADLPEKIVQIGPIGSRKSYTVYNATRDVVQCGCWNNYKGGALEDFRKRVEEVYQDGQYLEEYMAAIEFFQKMRDMEAEK